MGVTFSSADCEFLPDPAAASAAGGSRRTNSSILQHGIQQGGESSDEDDVAAGLSGYQEELREAIWIQSGDRHEPVVRQIGRGKIWLAQLAGGTGDRRNSPHLVSKIWPH